MSDLIIPPKKVCKTIEKTAQSVASWGEELEKKLINLKKDDPTFSFLIPEDPFYPFYQMKLEEAKNGIKKAPMTSTEVTTPKVQETKAIPKIIPNLFLYKQPNDIGGLQLDIIHLVAQYSALYGNDMLKAIAKKEADSPLFNFLKPDQPYFRFFVELLDQYKLAMDPSNQLRRRMEQEAASIINVKANLDHEAEFQKMKIEQKRKEALEAKKDDTLEFYDWDEFNVLGVIEYDDDEQSEKQTLNDEPTVKRTLKKQRGIQQISPITGQRVNVEEFGDHLRFELQHPQYQKELTMMKERKENQNSSLASGDEIARNLQQFSKNVSPLPPKNTVIWDGREETIEKSVSEAVYLLDKNKDEEEKPQNQNLKKPPIIGPTFSRKK